MKQICVSIAATLALCLSAPAVAAAQPAPAAPKAASAVAATSADLKAGAQIRDVDGALVGTIVSSTDQAVVVDTGQTKIGVPLTFFKKDDKGVLLSVTAKQFNDAIAKAHARAQAQQQQPAQQAQQPH